MPEPAAGPPLDESHLSRLFGVSACDEPKSFSVRMRFTFFAHGVFLPAILLLLSLGGLKFEPSSPWQSGEIRDYLAMLLRPTALLPFLPGIVYSAVSMAAWTFAPEAQSKVWVRVGIYSGLVLALQFATIVTWMQPYLIVLAAIVWTAWHVVLLLFQYFSHRQLSIMHIMVLTTLAAVCAMSFAIYGKVMLTLPLFACIYVLGSTPILNVIAYAWAVIALLTTDIQSSHRERREVGYGLIALAVAWLVEWRFAIVAMLDEYSKLPTTNPNCYLSNAAAYAHPCLTGARERGAITIGMRRLKFVELVFKATAPGLHRSIRRHYDRFGPPLARLCRRNYLLATVTCVCLKPIELVAEGLRLVLQIRSYQLQAIYGSIKFDTLKHDHLSSIGTQATTYR